MEAILDKLLNSSPYSIISYINKPEVRDIFDTNIGEIYERFIPGPYIPALKDNIFELSQYYSHNCSIYLNVIRSFASDDLPYVKTVINVVNEDSIIELALRYNRLDWLPELKIKLDLSNLESKYLTYYYEYLRFISPKRERIFDTDSSSSVSSTSSQKSSSGSKPRFDKSNIDYHGDIDIEFLQYAKPNLINVKRLNYSLHGPNMTELYEAYVSGVNEITNEYQFVGMLMRRSRIEPEIIYIYLSLYPELTSYLYRLPNFLELYAWMRDEELLETNIWTCLPYMDVGNLVEVLNNIDYNNLNISYYLWLTAVTAMNNGEGVKACIISKYCSNIFELPITSIVYPSVVGNDSAISEIFIRIAYAYEPLSIAYYSAYLTPSLYRINDKVANLNYNQLVGLALASIHYSADIIISKDNNEIFPYWEIYDINFNVYLTQDYKSYIYVYNIQDIIAGVVLGAKILGHNESWYVTVDKRKFTKLTIN